MEGESFGVDSSYTVGKILNKKIEYIGKKFLIGIKHDKYFKWLKNKARRNAGLATKGGL